jgi:hypothetical protein
VLSVDPVSGRVHVIAHLPHPLAHAAGAALGSTFYVLGGRDDSLTGQTSAIWAIDPASGHRRRAGRLPVGLSDLSAVTDRGRVLVVGGRDAGGRVHSEILELKPR